MGLLEFSGPPIQLAEPKMAVGNGGRMPRGSASASA
jgi:hypothetical protein